MVEEKGEGVVLVDGPLSINNIDNKEKKIYTYMNIIPGKKSASWQLVAIVMGPNTMQGGKIAKINPNSKENVALTARLIFWLPSLLKFFPCITYEI